MSSKEQQIGVQRLTKADLELIMHALNSFKNYPLGASNTVNIGYEQRVEQIRSKIEQDSKWEEAK